MLNGLKYFGSLQQQSRFSGSERESICSEITIMRTERDVINQPKMHSIKLFFYWNKENHSCFTTSVSVAYMPFPGEIPLNSKLEELLLTQDSNPNAWSIYKKC